jgi:hypothetical protein
LVKFEGKSISEFVKGFKSEATRETYYKSLRQFLNDIDIEPDEFLRRTKNNPKWMERLVLDHVEKRRKEVGGSYFRKLTDALKHFFDMNDVDSGINWSKLTKMMPKARKVSSDRSPTTEEIRKIVENSDIRTKCLVLLMCSSGVRVGAFDYVAEKEERRYLSWKDVKPITKDGTIVAVKLTVYRDAPEEYTTFATPEFYKALLEYKQRRESIGEVIAPDSPLIRDVWDDNRHRKERNQDPRIARPLGSKAIANEMGRFLQKIGIRNGRGRHEFKQVHGFRKFFESQAQGSGVIEVAVKKMMGYLSSYYKPTDDEYLREYLKAVPHVTISEAVELKNKLEKQIVVSDKKVGQLERENVALQDRLGKIEVDYRDLRKLVEARILSPKS